MQAIDRSAIEDFGIPGLVLMENAGLAAASLIHESVPDLIEKKILIVCGKGNNGGDGFVIARHLFIDGVTLDVLLLGKRNQLKADARVNADIAFKMGIPIHEVSEKISRTKTISSVIVTLSSTPCSAPDSPNPRRAFTPRSSKK